MNCMGIKSGGVDAVWERVADKVLGSSTTDTPSKRKNRENYQINLEKVFGKDEESKLRVISAYGTGRGSAD